MSSCDNCHRVTNNLNRYGSPFCFYLCFRCSLFYELGFFKFKEAAEK